jgi:hypothetical protein
MASPSTIITFTDADGDEFPVRLPVPGPRNPAEQDRYEFAARRDLEQHIAEGIAAPTMPVKVTKVEEV